MEETSSPTVLRDLDLLRVELVPREEALPGCEITGVVGTELSEEEFERLQNEPVAGFSMDGWDPAEDE